MGTPADLRPGVAEAAQFKKGDVMVYTNRDKQQVVMAQSVTGPDVDWTFVPQEVEQGVSSQTFRSVMRPNEYGTLEVTERVDSRSSRGELLGSWMRVVESDPMVGGFSIHIPGR